MAFHCRQASVLDIKNTVALMHVFSGFGLDAYLFSQSVPSGKVKPLSLSEAPPILTYAQSKSTAALANVSLT